MKLLRVVVLLLFVVLLLLLTAQTYIPATPVQAGRKAFVTTDFTDANASGLQAITGLTFNLSTVAQSFVFHCSLRYSQATASASDQFGVGVITTAPISVNVFSSTYTNVGAASPVTTGVLSLLNTSTPTSVVTFTPGASATIFGAYLDGTVETTGGGTSTFNIYVTNGTAANVIIIKRGSYCEVTP
jgi:hypothetical protein